MDNSWCKTLSEIDRFGSKQSRESLLFLTRAFANVDEQERLAQDCTASEVYKVLCPKLLSPAKAVLQRMLKAARYDEKRVSKLQSHTDHTSSVTVSNLLVKLSFYELLLILSYKIDTCPKGRLVLKHMLGVMSEEKIGAPKQDIKNALHLFTCMLTAGTLASCKPYTVISELQQLLSSMSTSDELVKMVIEDVEEAVVRNVTQVGESDIWIVNPDIEDVVKTFPEDTKCGTKCIVHVSWVTALLSTLVIVALVLLAVLASRCIPLATTAEFDVDPQHFDTWTDATFWAFGMALSTHRYSDVKIDIEQPYANSDDQVPYAVNTSIIPCNNTGPPKAVLLNETRDCPPVSNCDPESYTNRQNCHINFVDGDTLKSSSPYVLKGSRFNITLQTESLQENETVLLYIYRDVSLCSSYSFNHEPHQLYKGGPIKLSKMGNKSLILSVETDGFFCGFLASNETNITYSISRYIIGYDFESISNDSIKNSYYHNTKPNMTTVGPLHHPSNVCVLLSVTNDEFGMLNFTLTPVKVTIPECIKANVLFLVFSAACLIVALLIILCCCCCISIMYKNTSQHMDYYQL